MGSSSRTDFATSTALTPARRNTADHNGCPRLTVAAHPETHVDAFVLHAVSWRRDIFQINRRAVVLADDEVVVLLGGRQLSLRLQQEAAMRAVELPRAGVSGAVLDGVGQVFQRDIAGRPSPRDRL